MLIDVGFDRTGADGKTLLRLFGMTGHGVSFNCNNCARQVENRLPFRCGTDTEFWFCSVLCAAEASGNVDMVEKLNILRYKSNV